VTGRGAGTCGLPRWCKLVVVAVGPILYDAVEGTTTVIQVCHKLDLCSADQTPSLSAAATALKSALRTRITKNGGPPAGMGHDRRLDMGPPPAEVDAEGQHHVAADAMAMLRTLLPTGVATALAIRVPQLL
jgi:hypothetical protein